ncbi:WD40-repeat-containing domain protein [Suillus lakei]|nr:WD40-repeat-containing domain protein [Suillus lakei]
MDSPANEFVAEQVIKVNRNKQRVPAIAFLLNLDQHILTCSDDGCLQVIDAKSCKLLGDPWQGKEKNQICAIDVSPDGERVATGSKDGKIQVWKWSGKAAKIIAESKKHSAAANCVCWSRHDGGAHIASGFDDGSVAVWSVSSGLKNSMSTDDTRLRHIHAINYSHDGTQLVVSGYDREISRLTVDEKAQEVQVDDIIKTCNNPDHVSSITWASTTDGHAIVTGSTEGKIRIIELPEGRLSELEDPGHSDLVCTVVLSPDKRVLASASYDRTLRFWDLNAKRIIGQPLLHSADLTCAAFAANGTSVATGTRNGEIYVWSIEEMLSRVREMSTEDMNGRDQDANTRLPFNPNSPIPTRQHELVRRLPLSLPVSLGARTKSRYGNGFFDTARDAGDMSAGSVNHDKTRRFSISRHVKVAASRTQQALRVPRIQLERPVSNVNLSGVQEESQQNSHTERRRVSRTPLSDGFDQQSRETAEPARGVLVVRRTRWANALLRMKCVQLDQID